MKKLTVALLLLCCSVAAFAQGQVTFVNRTGSGASLQFAPVYNVDGTTALDNNYSVQLYFSTAATKPGALDSSLVAVGPVLAFRSGSGAGSFSPRTIDLPGTTVNQQVWLQARAWATAGGASYEAAKGAGSPWGQSTVFQSGPLGGTPPPPGLPVTAPSTIGNAGGADFNFTSFSLVPEPSVIALGALGAVALLLRRRKA